jgi:glycosyltransferase involved in cell wall biosynthesis
MPKISVCIPTLNGQRYIRDALDSVFRQEFDDYEVVVCDNASTDRTAEICRSYTDARLRYVRFEERTNQAGSFNRCLNAATGEYLTLLHADDFVLQGFFEDRLTRLDENQNLGFVFGAVKIVDANGAFTSTSNRWLADRTFTAGELLDFLLFGCLVCPPSLMVRKSVIERVGKFRTDLTWGHDWEWTLRLAEQCGAQYASEPLAAYRVHAESGTEEQLKRADNGRQEREILKAALSRLETADSRFRLLRRPALRALSHRQIYFAEQAVMGGRGQAARNNLWYAAKSDLKAITRPTFWAILAASSGSLTWYAHYRRVRDAISLQARRV